MLTNNLSFCSNKMLKLTAVAVLALLVSVSAEDSTEDSEEVAVRGLSQIIFQDYPYVASVKTRDGVFFCAGAIIDELWVLTAAHCFLVNNRQARNLIVTVGNPNVFGDDGVSVGVEHLVIHADFVADQEMDLALLKLSRELHFSPTIQTIKINDIGIGYEVTLVGWGLDQKGYFYQVLSSRRMLTSEQEGECTTSQHSLCATAISSHGICYAYFGGILVDGWGKLVGISSGSSSGCSGGLTETFTRVSSFKRWMDYVIENV